jgi:c(7)-type cytochrome triheme protein
MRHLVVALVLSCFVAGSLATLAQEEKKKTPAKLTFTAKNGNVTFNHAEHVKRAANDCKFCHDKLWPQSNTAPLNFKAGMHKTAEAAHTSCSTCHYAGGKSFGTVGNCAKCHVKAG